MTAIPVGPGLVAPAVAPAVAPSVQFQDARRPEAGTLVRLEMFDGPLALLLALIEARRLDVLTVPLGALADAYLDALATLEADRIGHVSSFVAVASQLILIKSRALLPRQEEVAAAVSLDDEVPDPEAELRARLLLYRAYRDGGNALAQEALARIGLFRREPGAARGSALGGARPADGPPLDPSSLAAALAGLVRVVPEAPPPPEVMPRTITLAERAWLIRDALRGAGPVVLQELLNGVRDRVVVAVTFLAMLELVKRREVAVEQTEPWGPIVVRQTTLEERGGATSEELAATPIDESLDSFA
jgi:segregation and condensation protein A